MVDHHSSWIGIDQEIIGGGRVRLQSWMTVSLEIALVWREIVHWVHLVRWIVVVVVVEIGNAGRGVAQFSARVFEIQWAEVRKPSGLTRRRCQVHVAGVFHGQIVGALLLVYVIR